MVLTIAGLLCLCVGVAVGFLIRWMYAKSKLTSAEQAAQRLAENSVKDAEARAKEIILETRDKLLTEQKQNEREIRERRSELQKSENRLEQKEENLERKQQEIERIRKTLNERAEALSLSEEQSERLREKLNTELERIASLSRDEAKNLIIDEMRKQAEKEGAQYVSKIEQETRDRADEIAREIVAIATQRVASEVSGDISTATIDLPSDALKGKIIGREGRNIRALETLTGVDVIIDDTPGSIVISCFDPVRREIARIAIERLILDGRVQPARIEEIVNKVSKEVGRVIVDEGESAVFDLSLQNMSPELIKALGRLHFRTSYGQNVLRHSKEVAILAGMIASEIGADANLAKRAGLLHDIGKGVETESEEGHAIVGAELAERLGETEAVVNCIASHHGDVQPTSIEAILVRTADAISAARPGARRESLENYIKRVESLENIARGYEGVESAFAVQAGRELRVLVNCEKVGDEDLKTLGRNIASRIEAELRYPGKIKVTVIRENRFMEYAK